MERKKEPIYSLCQERIPWRLYILGAAIRKALEPCRQHLLEILDHLFQSLETMVTIRTFG